MKKSLLLLTLLVFTISLKSQNLVPNPSFEEINNIAPEWSGTFSAFHRRTKLWSSPNQGSPDLLYLKFLDIMNPKRKLVDLENYTPRTGNFMIGFKTFGCETSQTLHCKEYLQIRLEEPLKTGEQYHLEYWIQPVKNSVKVNSFGAALNFEKMQEFNHTGSLDVYPIWMNEKIITIDTIHNGWQSISTTFRADDAYQYLIIGNFSSDRAIAYIEEQDGMDYGYYLLDDVSLRHLPRGGGQTFEVNKSIVLENILFELGNAELQEISKPSLDKLANYLTINSQQTITIIGHTDNQGTKAQNLQLSEDRANTIANYLLEAGIATARIQTIGKGSEEPMVDNDTPENRQKNRRVEIKILN